MCVCESVDGWVCGYKCVHVCVWIFSFDSTGKPANQII